MHLISAEVCQTCHEEIYRQWKGSMHANSTALKDPIHGAFYGMEVGDPTAEGQVHKKSGTYPICLQCHAPNAARDKTTKLDAHVAYSEGVNCVACHTLQNYKGIQGEDGKLRLGLKAYEVSDSSKVRRHSRAASRDSRRPATISSAERSTMRRTRRNRTRISASRSRWTASRSRRSPWRLAPS
jgi:hypothetical protein